jgi:hypothetical protein
MKKTIKLLTFALTCIQLNAQDPLVGKKFIQGSIELVNNNISSRYTPPSSVVFPSSSKDKQNDFTLNSSALFGKIDNNLRIKSVGFIFNTFVQNRSGSNDAFEFQVGPSFGTGKFVKLYEKIYFVPTTNINVFGIYGKSVNNSNIKTISAGAGANLSIVPIRLAYLWQEKIMLSASIGDVSAYINYRNFASENNSDPDLNGKSSTKNFNIGVRGAIAGSTSFGITYLFN